MSALAALIRRDIRIALRVGGGALIGVLFFLIVVVLMPFAVGPDLALLKKLGPAILWLGALLASLLTLDRLFAADHDDGSLDLLTMSRTPLELVCLTKAIAHWLVAGLPLIVATPILGLLLNLDGDVGLKPPSGSGHVYELRTYRTHLTQARPWANLMKEYLPAREKYSPIHGLWTGEFPQPNSVAHMWVYKDLAARTAARAGATPPPSPSRSPPPRSP